MASDSFETIRTFRTEYTDEQVNVECSWYRSVQTDLNVLLCNVPSDCVFGTFVFLTESKSNKPLAACVQRLSWCGSQNFPANFVERVGREISMGFAGSILHSDRSIFTINAQSDRGLIALLPPYLDALFLPCMTEHDFREQIYTPRNSKGRPGGEMYKELLAVEQNEKGSSADLEKEIYPTDTPYHYNCRGTSQALAEVTLAEVRAFHKHYYRPSNCFVILAGILNESDILEVLASFESQLPRDLCEYSLQHPCTLHVPLRPPRLVQPPQIDWDEEITDNYSPKRVQSPIRQLNSVVRFSSEVLEVERAKQQDENAAAHPRPPPLFNVHFAVQGPDLLNHEEWSAFNMVAKVLKEAIAESNDEFDSSDDLEFLSINTEDRKFPLAAFTLRALPQEDLQWTEEKFKSHIQRFLTRGDPLYLGDSTNVRRLLDNAVNDYRDQLSWRSEYDIVMSLSLWVSSCEMKGPEAEASFFAALHPAADFRILRKKSASWWIHLVQQHFTSYVSLIEIAKNVPLSADRLLDSGRRSSRWTLSSAASDRGIPRDLKDMRECHWETDATVEAYFASIGGREVLQGPRL